MNVGFISDKIIFNKSFFGIILSLTKKTMITTHLMKSYNHDTLLLLIAFKKSDISYSFQRSRITEVES